MKEVRSYWLFPAPVGVLTDRKPSLVVCGTPTTAGNINQGGVMLPAPLGMPFRVELCCQPRWGHFLRLNYTASPAGDTFWGWTMLPAQPLGQRQAIKWDSNLVCWCSTNKGRELLTAPVGVLTWLLNLNAGEQKKLLIRYAVEYPKHRRLAVE